jgi:hypothetical protein
LHHAIDLAWKNVVKKAEKPHPLWQDENRFAADSSVQGSPRNLVRGKKREPSWGYRFARPVFLPIFCFDH